MGLPPLIYPRAGLGGKKIKQRLREGFVLQVFVRAARVHQWAKNLLIFAPLILSQTYKNPENWVPVILGFLAFGLCASATYLWNDAFDVAADRAHPTKRNRPIASGQMSLSTALGLSAALLVGSFSLSALSGGVPFTVLLLVYIATTLSYSLLLKRMPIIDVLTLCFLYSLRIVAGGIAAGVEISAWLLSFSVFFFLSLGFVKRFSDMSLPNLAPDTQIAGRGYMPEDGTIVQMLGVTSGFCSVLVMALYITDPAVTAHYENPDFLWIVCLSLLYWLARVWLLASRRRVPDDPVVFAIRDPVSIAVAAAVLAGIVLAGMPIRGT